MLMLVTITLPICEFHLMHAWVLLLMNEVKKDDERVKGEDSCTQFGSRARWCFALDLEPALQIARNKC